MSAPLLLIVTLLTLITTVSIAVKIALENNVGSLVGLSLTERHAYGSIALSRLCPVEYSQ